MSFNLTVRLREWEPAFLRQAREFLFFPLLPREASKWVPIFDRGTGSKPERLRSGFLQADLSLGEEPLKSIYMHTRTRTYIRLCITGYTSHISLRLAIHQYVHILARLLSLTDIQQSVESTPRQAHPASTPCLTPPSPRASPPAPLPHHQYPPHIPPTRSHAKVIETRTHHP